MKYLLTVRFMGGAYSGWQYQNNALSVQKVMTEACRKLLGDNCSVTGCSRTDAGVHARGYMAAVSLLGGGDFPVSLNTDSFPSAINALLPEDISVLKAELVPDTFHPRYDAKSKTYWYIIINGKQRDPFFEGRAFFPRRLLSYDDIQRMNDACLYFRGSHDFSSFMSSGSSIKNTVRHIYNIKCRSENGLIVIEINADGFLYNMARIISGTLFDVGIGKLSPDEIPKIIDSHDRNNAGPTLPAFGLYLYEVNY